MRILGRKGAKKLVTLFSELCIIVVVLNVMAIVRRRLLHDDRGATSRNLLVFEHLPREYGERERESLASDEAEPGGADLDTNARMDLPFVAPHMVECQNRLYVITPTYARYTQTAELTRLAQTLMLVSNIHWIVIEDSLRDSAFVSELLSRMPFPYTHLTRKTKPEDRVVGLRGIMQRNAALEWIRTQNLQEGVFYFADDDNTYDIRAFSELSSAREVALVATGNMLISGFTAPIVRKGKVAGVLSSWQGGRKWGLDMANFAVNIQFWLKRGAPYFTNECHSCAETKILEAMNVTLENFEAKGDYGSKILAWHTQTKKIELESKFKKMPNQKRFLGTNIPALLKAEYGPDYNMTAV